MKKYNSVADYIEDQTKWKAELLFLRQICIETELEETLKWSIPTYTVKNKNVVGIGAFKNHVAMWFFQGTFLKDPYKKLINAQEGTTKGLLQWRFTTVEEMDPKEITEYLIEAIANEKAGKRIKIDRKKELIIPEELKTELEKDSKLNAAFEAFTPFKKREFAEYIGEAKRAATRIKRLEKCTKMILKGVGLNDKYR